MKENWYFEKKLSLGVLVQVMFLGALILGSWINIQRKLEILEHDVGLLLECQKKFANKISSLGEKNVVNEYRLESLEKEISKLCQQRNRREDEVQ